MALMRNEQNSKFALRSANAKLKYLQVLNTRRTSKASRLYKGDKDLKQPQEKRDITSYSHFARIA